ncbi:MAG: hypothetical protein K0R51_2786 [Cytophagaceae bacterium]|jgi:hypothetical protein|nr:hypothetical protein [Cytophagaceae bacterium]
MHYMNTIFLYIIAPPMCCKNLSPPEQGEADLVYF